MTMHVQQTSPFPWQGERQCSLQLLIQPWICAPGTQYGWVDQGSLEYNVFPTLLHMANTGNRTPYLLILSLTPYPLGHMFPHIIPFCNWDDLSVHNLPLGFGSKAKLVTGLDMYLPKY